MENNAREISNEKQIPQEAYAQSGVQSIEHHSNRKFKIINDPSGGQQMRVRLEHKSLRSIKIPLSFFPVA